VTPPEPLTPPDCDLRGLEYMPLLGGHLFGSEFNARANDSEWRAALTLWWAAWCQVPAASLPDDDAALCRFADLGRDLKSWRKLRDAALHGWVKCADGRLYHPLLAKQALIAWDKRVKERDRKAAWRAKKVGQEQSADADVTRDKPQLERGQERGQDGQVPADVTRRDGTGRKEEELASRVPAREEPPAGPPGNPEFTKIIEAAGFARMLSAADRKQLDTWKGQGLDVDEDIIPVLSRLRERERERGKTIGSLAYADGPIQEQRAADQREREYLRDVADRYGSGGGMQ
jgi:hypothetical protein